MIVDSCSESNKNLIDPLSIFIANRKNKKECCSWSYVNFKQRWEKKTSQSYVRIIAIIFSLFKNVLNTIISWLYSAPSFCAPSSPLDWRDPPWKRKKPSLSSKKETQCALIPSPLPSISWFSLVWPASSTPSTTCSTTTADTTESQSICFLHVFCVILSSSHS